MKEYKFTIPSLELLYQLEMKSRVALTLLVSVKACCCCPLDATFAAKNAYTSLKRGLAYNQFSLCASFGNNIGFMYNWGQIENGETGTKFVPMMHSPTKSTIAEWLASVDKAVARGSQAVMGFNECDHAEQWNPVKARYPNITIVGPSVTNGPAPDMGLSWLSKFHEICPDAIIDATNIHFYDIYDSTTTERFKSHVHKAYTNQSKKVWITEFGLNPGSATQDQAAKFLTDCVNFLEGSDDVQAYSWFMVGTGENQLNTATGLSPLGKIYANVL
jgi:hypothetical protein